MHAMAKTFEFNSVSSIRVSSGGARAFAELIGRLPCKRLLVVSDPGVIGAGLLSPALDSLDAHKIPFRVFSDVEADPAEAVIHAAVKIATEFEADGIVGFGGGSSMDVAKLVSLLAKGGQKLAHIYGVNQAKGTRLPLLLVPTTAGTGSEVTPISIVTTGQGEKKGVVSPLLIPDIALLDAELTLGLPEHITAATGVDAMVHAIEAYTGRIHKNPISDCFAREAIRLLSGAIHAACRHGQELQPREDMLIGACLAGAAFANSPVGAVHALAYPIGARFKVPHGLSNSLVLPFVVRFNLNTARDQYAELYRIISPSSESSAKQQAGKFLDYLHALPAQLGLPTHLRQVGITEQHVPSLAQDAMQQTRLLVNNPREMTADDAARIYTEALG
jgi:alcohol dehydrogenase class IV